MSGNFSLLSEPPNQYLNKFEYTRLILKPSTDSCSGVGVMLFERKGKEWICDNEGVKLTEDFLLNYRDNFVLQEAIEQHSYISQFCPTSVNTFRIAVYRSVRDESINVLGTIMRIGKNGSVCDNAHAGGMFIGIDKVSGALNKYVCDQYGNKQNIWNGIDFSKNNFAIPSWDKIIEFSKYIGSVNHHCRLLALDVALDNDGNPRLIEYNCDGFSYWLFMFTGQKPLGEFTDEIIEYCKRCS